MARPHHRRLGRRSSGIATYSQAGAQFGYALAWTLLLTYPLMCAIQMISAQVGRVTGKGLAGNMRRHYPALLVYPLIGLLLVANIINIGADLGAMAAALRLLVDGPQLLFVAAFAAVTILLEVFMRYSRYATVLRWLTISLLAYVATVFAVHVPWLTVAQNLVVPHIKLSGDYLAIVVAVFGTTISPYLFFWQAAEEVEDEKEDPDAKPLIKAPQQAPRQLARIQLDTLVGMGISNIIALFIMITTAATLNAHGVTIFKPRPRQRKRCALSQDVLLSRFLHWASLGPACLLCRSWRAALPTLWVKRYIGVSASPNGRGGLPLSTSRSRRRPSSEPVSISPLSTRSRR